MSEDIIEQARRLVAEHGKDTGALDPLAWARIGVGLGWDEDETVKEMSAHFDLDADTCRQLVLAAKREDQDIDLRNIEDDLTRGE